MNVVGPYSLKLVFQGFVVLVGALILSGAVNTSIMGANGVINRMVEDGVLTSWFKKPQKKFGTTYRVINMIAGLQLLTIMASRGNIYLLASLYAFGVIWSFSFMSLAVLVLRYKMPENREWKVPGNIRIGGVEIPLGLGLRFAGAVLHGHRQPVHQGNGDHCRREFQPGVLRGPDYVRARRGGETCHRRVGPRAVQRGRQCGAERARRWKCVRATSWWRCAIRTISLICARCCRGWTPPAPMSW